MSEKILLSEEKSHEKVKEAIINCLNDMYNPINISRIEILIDKFIKYGNFVVASKYGKIVGYISFYVNDLESKIGFISIIVVKKEFQGKGIGKLLLSYAINYAKDAGMKKIQLEVAVDNKSAIGFYKSFGFRFAKNSSSNSCILEKELNIV